MKTLTTTTLLTLLVSGGLWADDEFCPNSKITCPKDSSRCIEKFWSNNGDLFYEQMAKVKKTLPVNNIGGLTWENIIGDSENRRVNFIYSTNDDERALEILNRDYSGYSNVLNQCTLEKGLLCIAPGLTIRMVTYGENKKAINVKNYSREICRARGYRY
jgi:hypothetical protein